MPTHDVDPPSSLSAHDAAGLKVSASMLRSLGDDLYWIEGRPELEGRRVVICWPAGGTPTVVSPDGLSVASRVHEYGGGAMCVLDAEGPLVVAVRAEDQALVTFRPGDAEVEVLARVDASNLGDLSSDPVRPAVVAVAEAHDDGQVARSIIAVDRSTGQVTTLVVGADFYASPRISPSGDQLAWLTWDHPAMPWEAATLQVAPLHETAGVLRVGESRAIAGGPTAPAAAPSWMPDGSLVVAVEVDGWLRPHRWAGGSLRLLCEDEAEFAGPLWELAESEFAAAGEAIAGLRRLGGLTRVVLIEDGAVRTIAEHDQTASAVVATTSGVAWMGSTPTALSVVQRLDGDQVAMVELGPRLPDSLRRISQAEAVTAVAADGREVHGLLFVPTVEPTEPGPPPAVVVCHGGPTAQARAGFDPLIQAMCAIGVAVVAANYAGSTGYGADYRRRLDGAWGVADIDDCVALVEGLGAQDRIDPSRVAIRGGSAGGFTALLGLTTGAFCAAVSLYGVADLLTLAASTHDFEARYLDTLVGPLATERDRYIERSPVTRAGEMRGAALVLQGLDDPVVPPSQSEAIVAALEHAGQDVTLIEFEGESHGFRRLSTIEAALEAELAFYRRHLLHGSEGAAR